MTFTQRLKRVFNIGITEYEKCQKHNVTIIACIIDPHVIQKVLTHFDKKQPSSAQAKSILAPMREPPQQDLAPKLFVIMNMLSAKVDVPMPADAKICNIVVQNSPIFYRNVILSYIKLHHKPVSML
ncbi:hypothetical protein [Paraglaciecola psychrophila]|nr:hypothetical protein [Paraglaciecola psychrophila]GAC36952.1 hypothetical protein GPSY_1317 [Paraglaciecola psychrophila 170]